MKRILIFCATVLLLCPAVPALAQTQTSGACDITDAYITPSTEKGKSDDGYYSDASRLNKVVTITVATKNCAGKHNVYVSLTQFGDTLPTNGIAFEADPFKDVLIDPNVQDLDRRAIFPTTDTFNVKMHPGQDKCTVNPGFPDCRYAVRVGTTPDASYVYVTRNQPLGNLDYECDSSTGIACSSGARWQYIGVETAPNDVTVTPGALSGGTTDPACLDGSGNAVPGCYALSGGLAEALGNRLTINTGGGLGGFINSLVAFAIGIGGVLAVAMIVYEGFLYMQEKRDGNPSKVATTKGRITNTVIGFLLLLSVYVILRTVNPDLLNLTPRIGDLLLSIESSSPVDPSSKSTDEQPRRIVTPGSTTSSTNPTFNISKYDDFFKAHASQAGVDCTLMKADMYIESGGNPSAVSQVGARGLMQIMPAVAKTFNYNFDDMFDPEKNITVSSQLWNYNYRGACNGAKSNSVCNTTTLDYIIAANSAGAGANRESTTCPGKTVWQCTANAGYQETRDYIPKVTGAYNILKQKGWGCN